MFIRKLFGIRVVAITLLLVTLVLINLSDSIFAENRYSRANRPTFTKPNLIRKAPSNNTRMIRSDKKITFNQFQLNSSKASISSSSIPKSDINKATVLKASEGSPSDEIAINFEAVDLMSLVRYMSEETGKGFIINQPLKGNVTIISPIMLSKKEALAMLESILQVRGYTAVPTGKMYKIVSLSDAKVAGTETRTSDEIASLKDDDTLITQIVPLEKTSVSEAQKILATLLPRGSSMLLFKPSNTIVLTGRSVNIKRALEVLNQLEKGLSKPGLDIVPLKFSSSDEMKTQLEKIISSGGVERDKIKGGVTFMSDKRNNSLLILSAPENFKRIRDLIDRLDTATTDTRPELTKFFRLTYADESETVKQLQDILGIGKKKDGRTASETYAIETTRLIPIKRIKSIMVTTRSEKIMNEIAGLLKHLDSPPVKGSGDIKVIHIVNADAKELAATLARLARQRNKNTGSKNEMSVSFVADTHSNSLIMTGPQQLFDYYESIIKSLDVMRHQILVEVLIAEVSGKLTENIGIEWNVFNMDSSKWRAFGGTNYGLTGNPLTNTGFQIGLVKDTVDVAKLSAGNAAALSKIKAIAKAYKSNSNFKILSAPQILTTDNEEAKISVGEVVALPQGFTKDRDTGRFDLTNFKYEDVGIMLHLTPRVNSNDLVTLKLDQEIKKRQAENLYAFNVPVLTKRQMETTITVPNNKTIVIGGLMSEDKSKTIERVPLLSKLPLVGNLFKNRKKTSSKTNLMVFLTPHILSTPDEVAAFNSGKKFKERNDKIINNKVLSNVEKRMEKIREKARKTFELLRSK